MNCSKSDQKWVWVTWSLISKCNWGGPKVSLHAYASRDSPPSHTLLDQNLEHRVVLRESFKIVPKCRCDFLNMNSSCTRVRKRLPRRQSQLHCCLRWWCWLHLWVHTWLHLLLGPLPVLSKLLQWMSLFVWNWLLPEPLSCCKWRSLQARDP